MATTALISDLHLGAASRSDLLRRGPIQERLFEAIAGIDRIVLLGDVVELRDLPLGVSLAATRPFFQALGEAFAGREVVLVPGNHDHRLLGAWLERSRDGERPAELDEHVDDPHPAVHSLDGWLGEARSRSAIQGWVREDVYATHATTSQPRDHADDRAAIVAAIDARRAAHGSAQHATRLRAGPRPVYDLIFSLAQGERSFAIAGDGTSGGRPPAMRIWELMGGASGRARTLQGKLLGSAVIPAALRGMERAGFGSFTRDFSTGEIGRAGVEAMHVVVERLEIDATTSSSVTSTVAGRCRSTTAARPPIPFGSRAGPTCSTPATGCTSRACSDGRSRRAHSGPARWSSFPRPAIRSSSSCSATSTARSWPGGRGDDPAV